jgi:hypothetical protein
MKGKRPSLASAAALEREFERLLRRAMRMKAPGSPRQLQKISRRKPAA